MPKSPEELRKRTKQEDATKTVRTDGPFVSFPTKTVAGTYDLIKVPLTAETHKKEFEKKADHTTHHRYLHQTMNHKWYIPKDEHTTISETMSGVNEHRATTTYAPEGTFVSDKNKVVVHYHVNQWYHLHQHTVYYSENNWFSRDSLLEHM